MAESVRLLLPFPICDGHDSAIGTIKPRVSSTAGIEVCISAIIDSARDIVRAAIQEDVMPSASPVTTAARRVLRGGHRPWLRNSGVSHDRPSLGRRRNDYQG